jgi:twitching motility two-component system response regulator PilH
MSHRLNNKRFMLIVDNNIDDRFQMGMLLKQFGYNIFTTTSAEEALEIMSATPPVTVIADGGKTGMAIVTGIKKNPQFSDIPLIILSTTSNEMLEARARRGELAGFLRKPVDIEKLSLAVESILAKGPQRKIRITTALWAKLIGELGSAEGLVTVLSETGMFFQTINPHPLHTRLKVNFKIEGKPVTLEAEVVYNCTFEEGPFKEPGMGIKFVKVNPEDQAIIKAFVSEEVGKNVVQ